MRPLLALLTALAVLAPGLAAAQTSPPGFCDRNPDHWKCQATPTPTPTPTPTATVDPGSGGEQGPSEEPDESGGVSPEEDG
jgi:hypothetical protein